MLRGTVAPLCENVQVQAQHSFQCILYAIFSVTRAYGKKSKQCFMSLFSAFFKIPLILACIFKADMFRKTLLEKLKCGGRYLISRGNTRVRMQWWVSGLWGEKLSGNESRLLFIRTVRGRL